MSSRSSTLALAAALLLASIALPGVASAQAAPTAPAAEAVPTLGPKPFIGYFKPMPRAKLSTKAWGAA